MAPGNRWPTMAPNNEPTSMPCTTHAPNRPCAAKSGSVCIGLLSCVRLANWPTSAAVKQRMES
eukprot:scaffold3035_cov72-Phaeocystis_antarctica.AAC.4